MVSVVSCRYEKQSELHDFFPILEAIHFGYLSAGFCSR